MAASFRLMAAGSPAETQENRQLLSRIKKPNADRDGNVYFGAGEFQLAGFPIDPEHGQGV